MTSEPVVNPLVPVRIGWVIAGVVRSLCLQRSFRIAASLIVEHTNHLATEDWRLIVDAIWESYDITQYTPDDETTYGRRDLVALVSDSVANLPNAADFVGPELAYALAFTPASRALFISLASRVDQDKLDSLFDGKTCARQLPSVTRTGFMRHLNLLDIYWSSDLEHHVDVFLAAGRAPYVGNWHAIENLQAWCRALELPAPEVPFLDAMAYVIKQRPIERKRVSLCGAFFTPDPRCRARPRLADAVGVVRHLAIDVLHRRQRICHHVGAETHDAPLSLYEQLWAVEQLCFTLAPLHLPIYVALEIIKLVVGFDKRYSNQVVELLSRCGATLRRRNQTQTTSNEPAAAHSDHRAERPVYRLRTKRRRVSPSRSPSVRHDRRIEHGDQ